MPELAQRESNNGRSAAPDHSVIADCLASDSSARRRTLNALPHSCMRVRIVSRERPNSVRARYPRVGAVGASIFTRSGSIYTSAGVATGIDLALSLVEEDHGPLVASKVARALVVYLRRSGAHAQESVYLDFRTHDNPAVHQAQSWMRTTREGPAHSTSSPTVSA